MQAQKLARLPPLGAHPHLALLLLPPQAWREAQAGPGSGPLLCSRSCGRAPCRRPSNPSRPEPLVHTERKERDHGPCMCHCTLVTRDRRRGCIHKGLSYIRVQGIRHIAGEGGGPRPAGEHALLEVVCEGRARGHTAGGRGFQGHSVGQAPTWRSCQSAVTSSSSHLRA